MIGCSRIPVGTWAQLRDAQLPQHLLMIRLGGARLFRRCLCEGGQRGNGGHQAQKQTHPVYTFHGRFPPPHCPVWIADTLSDYDCQWLSAYGC